MRESAFSRGAVLMHPQLGSAPGAAAAAAAPIALASLCLVHGQLDAQCHALCQQRLPTGLKLAGSCESDVTWLSAGSPSPASNDGAAAPWQLWRTSEGCTWLQSKPPRHTPFALGVHQLLGVGGVSSSGCPGQLQHAASTVSATAASAGGGAGGSAGSRCDNSTDDGSQTPTTSRGKSGSGSKSGGSPGACTKRRAPTAAVDADPRPLRFQGLTWDRGTCKWRVRIAHHSRQVYVGRFATDLEAAYAYCQAALELYGETARVILTAVGCKVVPMAPAGAGGGGVDGIGGDSAAAAAAGPGTYPLSLLAARLAAALPSSRSSTQQQQQSQQSQQRQHGSLRDKLAALEEDAGVEAPGKAGADTSEAQVAPAALAGTGAAGTGARAGAGACSAADIDTAMAGLLDDEDLVRDIMLELGIV